MNTTFYTLLFAPSDTPKSRQVSNPTSEIQLRYRQQNNTFKMPHYQHSSYMGTGGRPLFTMGDHTHFLAAPHFLSFADPTEPIIRAPVHSKTHIHPNPLSTPYRSTPIILPAFRLRSNFDLIQVTETSDFQTWVS